MGYSNYKDLVVWTKSMDLVKEVYQLIELLPKEEKFSLADQIRRSVISIPSNIAEGESRKSKKEFINFLSIANGSRAELETQLLIGCMLGYYTEQQVQKAMDLSNEISRMIYALIKKMEEQ
ncbi:MAG: four helix bundle protein [Ruminococcaceae bacterium]|nr:four helix bundle protein [Oscillospiraceae bacterium]